MGPALDRWLARLSSFQTRRLAGTIPDPWREFNELESQVESLVVEGLDSRAAAVSLATIERASLLYEQREFDTALQLAVDCKPTMPLIGPAAELFIANRELLIGNVYLVRDAHYALAVEHFSRAIDATGPLTPLIRGNAAINRGICHSLMGDPETAIESYHLAADAYTQTGREDKRAVVLQSLGNAYRLLGRVEEGAEFLRAALSLHIAHRNPMGIWETADDLARAYLVLSDRIPELFDHYVDSAAKMSDMAIAASTDVWRVLRNEPGRLADLSDQMINLTITRCDIAGTTQDPVELLGVLALMKGRIRLSRSELPERLVSAQEPIVREGLSAGYPAAYTTIVDDAVSLLAPGKTIALLDQFAVGGNQLLMGSLLTGPDLRGLDGISAILPTPAEYDPSTDLRGRGRGQLIADEIVQLCDAMTQHVKRCQFVLHGDLTDTDRGVRDQLKCWAAELEPTLKRLGSLFFPPELLQVLREKAVTHLVLAIDPLFVRVPYSALIGAFGTILDEPWTLSLVTASTELTRIFMRREQRSSEPRPLEWYGPDKYVNEELGGDRECQALGQLGPIVARREGMATRDEILKSLKSGRWCHFRGHGIWTGSVDDSGPVLASDEVLSSRVLAAEPGAPGFLLTAACLTGFGEAVGIEAFGSLVDYDRANLCGAMLTAWPIHGDAATVFTSFFYEELKDSKNVAQSIKIASQLCREVLPHPCLWAPFALIGDWDAGHLIY